MAAQQQSNLVGRLTELVEVLRNQPPPQQTDSTSTSSISSALSSLFPSVAGTSGTSVSESGTSRRPSVMPSSAASSNNGTWRGAHYNPGLKYEPAAKKKRTPKGPGRGPALYQEKGEKAKEILKDIFLVPNPKASKVPRGKAREELCSNGFVSFAVSLNTAMSEQDVMQKVVVEFANKFALCQDKGFEFMKAVNDKLIGQDQKVWNGKVLKHMTGVGPLYIRSREYIPLHCQLSLSDSESDAEDADVQPTCLLKYFKSPIGTNQSDVSPDAVLSCSSKEEGPVGMPIQSHIHTDTKIATCIPSTSSQEECPICHLYFDKDNLNEHANMCADRISMIAYNELMSGVSDEEVPVFSATDDEEFNPPELQNDRVSLKDVIKHLSVNIDQELKENRIDVRRKSAWKDFCGIRNRRKFSLNAKLKVRFIGEAAIDTGGPLREFFSVLLDQIKASLFDEGHRQTIGGHKPSNNMLAVVSKEYRYAGEIMALSLVHGGPAPNWLEPWIYRYMVSGLEPMFIPDDHKWNEIYTKLSSCKTDSELRETIDSDEFEDALSDVGYRGIPSREKMENKENILKSLSHKVVVEPILPMMMQLQEGLDTLGVLQAARKSCEVFRPVFTPCNDTFTIRADDFLDNVLVDYSPGGSNRKEMEINTYKQFTDVVLAADDPENNIEFTPSSLFMFMTGVKTMPPLGLPSTVTVTFLHDCHIGCRCRPSASTCGLTLTLPVHIQSFQDMEEMIKSAIIEGKGFGNV